MITKDIDITGTEAQRTGTPKVFGKIWIDVDNKVLANKIYNIYQQADIQVYTLLGKK